MSTLKLDTLSNFAGTKSVPANTVIDGSAKAWVNFNGTGTIAIRASFNVSSITDLGAGTFTVNFTSTMPDANYSVVLAMNSGAGGNIPQLGAFTTAAAAVGTVTGTGATGSDPTTMCVAIYR